MNNDKKEIDFIERIHHQAFENVVTRLGGFLNKQKLLSKDASKIVASEFKILKNNYFSGLQLSKKLAKKALNKERTNKRRLYYFNPVMKNYRNKIDLVFPLAAKAWVLDGIIIENQIAGLKKLVGMGDAEDYIIDVLGSASSLSLGAHNPWLIKADRLEDYLQIRDNVCSAYHPGLKQVFGLYELSSLYPGLKQSRVTVHSESSGTLVDCIAIESVVSFAEKHGRKNAKVVAIDGTWAGGYGSAREATGYNVDKQQKERAGKALWVDRCLPPPVKKNEEEFLGILKNKIRDHKMAGLYIEPDVVGDLGVITVDANLLEKVKKMLLEAKIPIIIDCVQQLGRSGGYWGENVETILKNYPYLVVTTAKSASNGLPFGYTIIPKEIADCAYPLSHISTNQMNGPLLRVSIVAEIIKNEKFQQWLQKKSKKIEEIASEYGFERGEQGLRGKFLNRGIYVDNNETVKLAQIALLIEDGILVGALPEAIRYQPMLCELSESNALIARVLFKRIRKVIKGEISQEVINIYNKMKQITTGLARNNISN